MLAGALDLETPTDVPLATTLYLAAEKYGIKYILEGHSFRTEGISPPGWFYMDAKYIQTVHKQFGTVPIKTFPNLWLSRWLKWIIFDRIKKIRLLYYLNYKKEKAKKFLSEKFGWQWYGGHHMENRTAYFTNNYYLPKKFGIDLRYCEFSALIRSGQITREEALDKIAQPKDFDRDILEEVKKRLDLLDEEFERLMIDSRNLIYFVILCTFQIPTGPIGNLIKQGNSRRVTIEASRNIAKTRSKLFTRLSILKLIMINIYKYKNGTES